jgi:hypothetical protein
VHELCGLRDRCDGSKKRDLAMTLISATRLLELEAIDSQQKTEWKNALQWLIGAK